jgi:CRISPR/Cas system-associated endonuclease Cas1
MTAASFERTDNPKLPLRLTEPAIDALIGIYEQRLGERVQHADGGGQMTTRRRVIELQVRRLARLVLGTAKKYQPFLDNG